MSKKTTINKIEFVFNNLDFFSPFTEYAFYCSEKIQPIYHLTKDEYMSLVASYEFNKNA